MRGFLITPSLYSAWKYWKDSEDAGKEDLLDTLNKVEKRKSPAMQMGIDFENAIRGVCDGTGVTDDFCVRRSGDCQGRNVATAGKPGD
jgi:hypothetical protein